MINLNSLTINPQEVNDFAKVIAEKAYKRPEVSAIHNVIEGVAMKEQILIASQFGLTGKAMSGCSFTGSGAGITMSQKYWEPAKIADRLSLCAASQSQMFKPYMSKVQAFKDVVDPSQSDEVAFASVLAIEAIQAALPRQIWFGDKNVSNATSSAAGLIPVSPSNSWAFSMLDGLWKQIFSGVTAGTVKRTTISQNTPAGSPSKSYTAPTQAETIAYIDALLADADSRIAASDDVELLLDRKNYENLVAYLAKQGNNFTLDYTMNGFGQVKYMGIPVYNMSNVWDVNNKAYFENNTTDQLANLPYRMVLTTKANIPVATLNVEDFAKFDAWFDKKDGYFYIDYGYTLDAKVIDNNMIAVAY